jgi:FkbM family methyltransferase
MRERLSKLRARWREARMIRRGEYAREAYSQEGEDLILLRLIGEKPNGFYVDVGAHHPVRFSNTYLFYRMGWHGVNIDPMPGVKELFDRYRPRDINLEVGISDSPGEMTYFMFNEPALNGFDAGLSNRRERDSKDYRIIETRVLPTLPLSEILCLHVSARVEIDFLSVDCEGLDYRVLSSNDWSRFRPRYVLAEILDFDLDSPSNSRILTLLSGVGYRMIAKTVNGCIFVRRD